MGQQRSEEFRKAAVVKFHSRGSRTVEEIAQVKGYRAGLFINGASAMVKLKG